MKTTSLARVIALLSATAISLTAQVTLPALAGYSFSSISLPGGLAATHVQLFRSNDLNQIAGISYESGGSETKAFIYENGSTTEITIPGTSSVGVYDINASGQVVGNFGNGDIATASQAFVYSGGTATTLNLSATHAVANGINDSGVITGVIDNSAFTYAGGSPAAVTLPGNPSTYANAIDSAGTMVGQYGDSGLVHSWLRSGGVYYEVTVPGATEVWLNGINNLGLLSGFYAQSGVTGFTGFIGTPIPEPASATTWLALAGLALAAARRKASTASRGRAAGRLCLRAA